MTVTQWNQNRERQIDALSAHFADLQSGSRPAPPLPAYPANWRPVQNQSTREIFPTIQHAARSIGMPTSSLRVYVEANLPDPRTRSYWSWFPREHYLPMRSALHRALHRRRLATPHGTTTGGI